MYSVKKKASYILVCKSKVDSLLGLVKEHDPILSAGVVVNIFNDEVIAQSAILNHMEVVTPHEIGIERSEAELNEILIYFLRELLTYITINKSGQLSSLLTQWIVVTKKLEPGLSLHCLVFLATEILFLKKIAMRNKDDQDGSFFWVVDSSGLQNHSHAILDFIAETMSYPGGERPFKTVMISGIESKQFHRSFGQQEAGHPYEVSPSLLEKKYEAARNHMKEKNYNETLKIIRSSLEKLRDTYSPLSQYIAKFIDMAICCSKAMEKKPSLQIKVEEKITIDRINSLIGLLQALCDNGLDDYIRKNQVKEEDLESIGHNNSLALKDAGVQIETLLEAKEIPIVNLINMGYSTDELLWGLADLEPDDRETMLPSILTNSNITPHKLLKLPSEVSACAISMLLFDRVHIDGYEFKLARRPSEILQEYVMHLRWDQNLEEIHCEFIDAEGRPRKETIEWFQLEHVNGLQPEKPEKGSITDFIKIRKNIIALALKNYWIIKAQESPAVFNIGSTRKKRPRLRSSVDNRFFCAGGNAVLTSAPESFEQEQGIQKK